MPAALDFLRVMLTALLFYWALPHFSRRIASDTVEAWTAGVVPSILRGLFFFQLAGVTLGSWGIGFPGAGAAAVLFWIAVEITFSTRSRKPLDLGWWRAIGTRFLIWMELRGWQDLRARARRATDGWLNSPHVLTAAMFTAVMLVSRLQFPLVNHRFLDTGTYARAVSLNQMVHGQGWTADGSVAFLMPLVHFSGVDVAGVIRWSGSLISAGVLLAIGYAAWRWTERLGAAILAPLLFEAFQRWVAVRPVREATPEDMATVIWLLSFGLLRGPRLYAAGAIAFALTVEFRVPPLLAPALTAVALAYALSYLGKVIPAPQYARVRMVGLISYVLVFYSGGAAAPKDGPLQYEAAARAAERIASERPRNRYLIVSPTQDSIAVFGRGWHEELAEFVRRFGPQTPLPASFRFPYQVAEIFVFIEKEPLRQPEISPTTTSDANSYYYYTRLGRSSLQFQAARIMASYAKTHTDASIYFEDDRFMVYRVANGTP